MEYKMALGYLALAIQAVSYAIYFYGIWQGKTKPHAFTWMVWCLLTTLGFFAVLASGGGIGAWVLAGNGIANFAIAAVGFY